MGHNGNYPLDKGAIRDWEAAQQTANCLKGGIIDRIDYVLKVWFNAFGGTLESWYFEDAEENSMGDMYLDENFVYGIYINSYKGNIDFDDMVIIDKNGKQYSWEGEVPIRWLFEETFEKEIVEGKKRYEEKEANPQRSCKGKKSQTKSKRFSHC